MFTNAPLARRFLSTAQLQTGHSFSAPVRHGEGSKTLWLKVVA